MLALGLAERRRAFAILSAIGATSGQLGAFLWSEALAAAPASTVIAVLAAQAAVQRSVVTQLRRL